MNGILLPWWVLAPVLIAIVVLMGMRIDAQYGGGISLYREDQGSSWPPEYRAVISAGAKLVLLAVACALADMLL